MKIRSSLLLFPFSSFASGIPKSAALSITRRHFFSPVLPLIIGCSIPWPLYPANADSFEEIEYIFKEGPIGIELAKTLKGPCSVVVRTVRNGGKAEQETSIQPGWGISRVGSLDICRGREPIEVAGLIKSSNFPITLTFQVPSTKGSVPAKALNDENAAPAEAFRELRVMRLTLDRPCATISQEGDLLEIDYTARIADSMREYDSNRRRGTGQPFALSLGRGDVVRGLDLGLYDMCIGERRKIEVPSGLGYGSRGNPSFGVPSNSDLLFGVKLISINGVYDGEVSRGENYYTGDPCNDEAKKARLVSGLCPPEK